MAQQSKGSMFNVDRRIPAVIVGVASIRGGLTLALALTAVPVIAQDAKTLEAVKQVNNNIFQNS
jgi:hypothetical protein